MTSSTASASPAHRNATLWAIPGVALAAAVITLAGWKAFKMVSLPAFNTSMVTRALATVGIILTLAVTGALLVRRNSWLTHMVSYLSPALLTLASLGLPLSATRLWLDGVQVDQVFRTQFLTRMTETASHADMNYADLPTFYPMGWFWLGGRLANVLGIPGWEVYQPWALMSLAMAGCVLVPVWQRLTGSLPLATGIALTTTAVTLATGAAEEPYSAVIAMGAPAACVMAAHAFDSRTPHSWVSVAGLAIYLGASASFYTLFTAVIALAVVSLLALVWAVKERSVRPIVKLAVTGIGAIAIALVSWAPYLWAVLHHTEPLQSTAQHYLPKEGTQLPVPFIAPSIIGLLCLVGFVYLITRRRDRETNALLWGLAGIYLWIIGSMLATLAGSTLLGFRLEILVVVMLATAGIFAVDWVRRHGVRHLYPDSWSPALGRKVSVAVVSIALLAGVFYAQQIPAENETAIDHAYSDTDGYGERADQFAGDSSHYYADIEKLVRDEGRDPADTVVMTDEKALMAFTPYYGFNAFTSHYANPLGEFNTRNDTMEEWSKASWDDSASDFAARVDDCPWRSPDVMVFRGDKDKPAKDGFKLHLAEDIYPNQPNVRYRAIFFNPMVFDGSEWSVEQVGPFVVAVRN
ncbi:galactan 5-O-arabinofuranosyltransferase [Corynebacterium massiliense]|uniref:Galactan 5-O-arabinofuranosyltransferase n=1 Tax=Corynebacterium massiliense DSM 45435 TaxID=1121364 RepID=A0ABY7U752_9CORY|nr:galactan 5-O-arabinofuranosyltransferase [Corynebacterium massiliense]WCZ31573.1 Arabinofuranosyltransferase AftA [Corynebacterium massiliense DSM 45435]